MNKLTRISATVASSLALVAGFSGMASAHGISDSGRNSHNKISYSNQVRTTVRNTNKVTLTNNNPQTAYSGDANVNCNDDVNGVSTGTASNDSQVQADVNIDNSSSTSSALSGGQGGGSDWSAPEASITDSGRDSNNQISYQNRVTTNVTNDNTVKVTNNNSQTAMSGDANVNNNDDVRNVTTGDATNTSSATFSVNITN